MPYLKYKVTALVKFEKTSTLIIHAPTDRNAKVDTLIKNKSRKCPQCDDSNLMRDYNIAEIVCMNCGYVIDEKIMDTRPVMRNRNPMIITPLFLPYLTTKV